MDYEYDDDRPTDRADGLDTGEQMADTGLFADEFVFEAPDLATAFLAALDAVDDRRFVTPPPDILAAALPTEFPPASPASEPAATGSESIAHDTIAHESIAPESIAPESIAPDSTIAALEAGTLALPGLDDPADEQADEQAGQAAGYAAEVAAEYAIEQAAGGGLYDAIQDEAEQSASEEIASEETALEQAIYGQTPSDFVIEHEHSAGMAADTSPSGRAAAEAFAREQAALELWGSDPVDALASEDASEDAEEAAASAVLASDEASAEPDSESDLIAETVSNADSYYDPDTLALARPLFSPDEPSAFATPVYVGETPVEEEAYAEAEVDPEVEVLEDLEEFVAFSLGDTRCVVPIRNVIEIGRIPDAVSVPNAPAWLHGLGNLRGQVLSLIDLRAFLGIGRVRPATGRMLVLRADDDEVQAGLLVDHVHQIVSLSASRFHALPETLPQHYGRHAWGVCEYGNFIMIGLDVDSLLGVESLTPAEPAVEAEAV